MVNVESHPSVPAPRRPRRGLFPAAVVLTTFGLVVTFFLFYVLAFSGLEEHRSQSQLYATMRGLLDPASPVAPAIGGAIPAGSPIAVMTIPALGVSRMVIVEGTTSGDLALGPGHQRNSPLPGQVGQSIVMGKSVSSGAPLASLSHLRVGNSIDVTTGQGTFHFVVEGVRRAGSALPIIPKNNALLTLISTTGSRLFGTDAAAHLLYVDAALRGTPVPTPPHGPRIIHSAEIQGHGDSGAWPNVIMWLTAVVAVTIGIVVVARRWGFARTWVVATPVVLLALWMLSGALLRLLPNVY